MKLRELPDLSNEKFHYGTNGTSSVNKMIPTHYHSTAKVAHSLVPKTDTASDAINRKLNSSSIKAKNSINGGINIGSNDISTNRMSKAISQETSRENSIDNA